MIIYHSLDQNKGQSILHGSPCSYYSGVPQPSTPVVSAQHMTQHKDGKMNVVA